MKPVLPLLAALVALSDPALAADYPAKPVRIIVPTAPAGGADLLTRLVAQKLGDRMGEQFYIDNRPGAAGVIGNRIVSVATPDGYTLLMSPNSIAITTAINTGLSYDLMKDLKPITSVASTPYALIVNASLPVHSVKELIAYAKANPDKLNFGSAGPGSASHLAGELFGALAGIKMTHVPNKGVGPAMIDLMGGQVSVLIAGLPAAHAAEKDGRVRVLAVASTKRSALLPDMPTVAEAGVPGYEVENWFGLLAPAGIDAQIVARLHDEVHAIVNEPDTKQKLIAAGFEPVGSTPAAFSAQLDDDVKKWGAIAKQVGIVAGSSR